MKKHLRLATAAFAASALVLAGCNGDTDDTTDDTTTEDTTLEDGTTEDEGLDTELETEE